MRKVLGVLGTTLLLAGCGALFNGGPAKVAFTSSPDGADVIVDGTRRGSTPVILDLQKNQDYTVILKKDGYKDVTVALNKKVSAGYVVLDVLGGIIPIVVDAATGSWYVLSTNSVNASLEPTVRPAAHGQLSPAELVAVRNGAPVEQFINLSGASDAK